MDAARGTNGGPNDEGHAMAFRARRRRRGYRTSVIALLLVGGGAASAWWLYHEEQSSGDFDRGKLAAVPSPTTPPANPTLEPPNEEPKQALTPTPQVPPAPAPVESKPTPVEAKPSPPPASPPIESGKEALARNDLVAARKAFSDALATESDPQRQSYLRTELARISADTILSSRLAADDPLTERYVIRSGDVLAKIAASNKITADLLASINGIANKHMIREGQSLKLIHGPFRAVVHKRSYTLDVFLGDTFVREFKVGLGADDSTPTGEWRVSTKLVNPTYYPPRGGDIVSADDPKNPLGERWIGLVGVGGAAVDQQRYGVHGTSDPDSIGKNLSMGCIRLRNEDVEVLYEYLVENDSTVTVVD